MLTLDRIARHLLGDRLPGLSPQWVAPRGWDWTLFVAIDVDRRGDSQDFLRRCRQVEEALTLLDVPPEARLVVPMPSGGRHYYFFPSTRVRTEEIAPTLARVGIIAHKGKFELFPSPTQGLRMPFGHIPGQPHAPGEWLCFIDRYRQGAFPMVNWERCKQLAKRHAATHGGQGLLFHDDNDEPVALAEPRQPSRRGSQVVERKEKKVPFGVPKAVRQAVQPYEELLARPVRNPGDIEELLDLGIRTEGTRHEAVKRLAGISSSSGVAVRRRQPERSPPGPTGRGNTRRRTCKRTWRGEPTRSSGMRVNWSGTFSDCATKPTDPPYRRLLWRK
ncbi:MAG: hypothetical protein L0Z62_28065 [Gemmataceae bacterium]|nr:hypothetical protein [Gemmataceae bacterium]